MELLRAISYDLLTGLQSSEQILWLSTWNFIVLLATCCFFWCFLEFSCTVFIIQSASCRMCSDLLSLFLFMWSSMGILYRTEYNIGLYEPGQACTAHSVLNVCMGTKLKNICRYIPAGKAACETHRGF